MSVSGGDKLHFCASSCSNMVDTCIPIYLRECPHACQQYFHLYFFFVDVRACALCRRTIRWFFPFDIAAEADGGRSSNAPKARRQPAGTTPLQADHYEGAPSAQQPTIRLTGKGSSAAEASADTTSCPRYLHCLAWHPGGKRKQNGWHWSMHVERPKRRRGSRPSRLARLNNSTAPASPKWN